MNIDSNRTCDVLIVGGGSAGLRAAIEAHDAGAHVLIISKSKKADPHTVLARGGINAALGTMDPKDNWMVHAADTLREGEFLADYERVEEYVDKLEIIFAPLFFAIIGAQVNLNGINLDVLLLSSIIIAVAIVSKLIGCGLPASIFLRDKSKAMKVGIGMISRGEVGLIVAGIGVSAGVLSADVYATIIIMVAVTTLITPLWLKKAYGKEPPNSNGKNLSLDQK